MKLQAGASHGLRGAHSAKRHAVSGSSWARGVQGAPANYCVEDE